MCENSNRYVFCYSRLIGLPSTCRFKKKSDNNGWIIMNIYYCYAEIYSDKRESICFFERNITILKEFGIL